MKKVTIKTIANSRPLTKDQKNYWDQRLTDIIFEKRKELESEHEEKISKEVNKKINYYQNSYEIKPLIKKFYKIQEEIKELKEIYNEKEIYLNGKIKNVCDLIQEKLNNNDFYENFTKEIKEHNDEVSYDYQIKYWNLDQKGIKGLMTFWETLADEEVRLELSKHNVDLKKLDNALIQMKDALQMQNVPSSFFNLIKHLFLENKISAESILNSDINPQEKITKQ
ncbi:MAG: hypothetical protein Tp1124SUR272871_24 [Prokaryotic dsDNA virus sp.]|nr:MAG: hypothetical protein Tp1125SUR00d2C35834131_14 [Prokaryotic dsDNA virus sp.]QDP67344.1 MAG: hypothetical protein Tp1124SUR272871_24 [Prokaryotic dsDNA virus sp.]|tara:strand:- start:7869 stop:8540 length:672 start_codon:yes stop_codon:yes gene_type:complete